MSETKMSVPMSSFSTECSEKTGPITWKDLCDYVEKPVYDAKSGTWRILHGYKQYGDEKHLFLSDAKSGIEFKDVELYKSDDL